MNESQSIQLPPPRRHQAEARDRSPVALALWVVTALLVGLSVGMWLSSRISEDSVDVAKVEEQSGEMVRSATAMRVTSLLEKANEALENEGDWIKAQKLYTEALATDDTQEVALAVLPVIERHLDSVRGSVNIATEPPGAIVRLGTFSVQKTPATFNDVPLGDYMVEIALDGYQTVTRNISVKSEKPEVLNGIALSKSAGAIEVTSLPSGLAYQLVKKSGEKFEPIREGKTPERIDQLPEGEYEVKMAREGWPAYSASVDVQHNRNASVSHVFESGGLNVMSDPPKAEIWVKPEGMADYRLAGETPIGISDLPIGKVAIELRYLDWPKIRRTVDVKGGNMEEPLNFAWKRGLVTFESDPPKAEIYKNGQRIGSEVTPFSMEMPEGSYSFTAVYPQLDSVSRTTNIEDGDDNSVEFKFAYGTVELNSTPTGAGVILEGKPIGKTPLRQSVVRPGTYTWQLQKDKFQSTSITGEVRPGQSMNFSAELTYDPTPKTERGFANGLGQQMIWVPQLGGWVGATEVTQSAYELLAGENPSEFVGENFPVDSVSWYKANAYCEKLTNNERARDALPRGYAYRLPTDAEWSRFVGNASLNGAVTSKDRTRTSPVRVGSSPPNEFGLYDVRGNAWEWCQDWYSLEILNQMRTNSISGGRSEWTGTARKVVRGGSWSRSNDTDLAVGYRLGVAPEKEDRIDCGFRVVLMPE